MRDTPTPPIHTPGLPYKDLSDNLSLGLSEVRWGPAGRPVEFPACSGQRLAVVLVVRPFVLGRGNVPQ